MTILSESTQTNFVIPILVIGIIMLVFSVLVTWADFEENKESPCGILLFALGTLVIILSYRPYTKCRAIIDDKYPAKELYESYDIIGKEGEMYVLKAKESDEDGDV